jgi:hypothetical protein
MCYKVAVMMPPEEFVTRMREWVRGGPWAEMDQYGEYVGVTDRERLAEPGLLVKWGDVLVTWLWGNEETLRGILGI